MLTWRGLKCCGGDSNVVDGVRMPCRGLECHEGDSNGVKGTQMSWRGLKCRGGGSNVVEGTEMWRGLKCRVGDSGSRPADAIVFIGRLLMLLLLASAGDRAADPTCGCSQTRRDQMASRQGAEPLELWRRLQPISSDSPRR